MQDLTGGSVLEREAVKVSGVEAVDGGQRLEPSPTYAQTPVVRRATPLAQVSTAALGHAVHTWMADPSSEYDALIVHAFARA